MHSFKSTKLATNSACTVATAVTLLACCPAQLRELAGMDDGAKHSKHTVESSPKLACGDKPSSHRTAAEPGQRRACCQARNSSRDAVSPRKSHSSHTCEPSLICSTKQVAHGGLCNSEPSLAKGRRVVSLSSVAVLFRLSASRNARRASRSASLSSIVVDVDPLAPCMPGAAPNNTLDGAGAGLTATRACNAVLVHVATALHATAAMATGSTARLRELPHRSEGDMEQAVDISCDAAEEQSKVMQRACTRGRI
mmetsp:Transcript_2790/g.11007  ORF Transcript_2790/g.11007 Transcript_2790/m.11007 type:complete len:253 (-) Transcript_2790:2-760(-)